MSDLSNLGDVLAAKLDALPEAKHDELIAFVKAEVSWIRISAVSW